jgi:hypothetical protein
MRSLVIEYIDLLRVIRKGLAVKNIVDEAIDQCAVVFNLRDSIEEARAMAEVTTDERQKRIYASKGVHIPFKFAKLTLITFYRSSRFEAIFYPHHFPGLLAINRARHDALV